MIIQISNSISLDYNGFMMRLFLLFLIYAIMGWIIEVVSFRIEHHKLVNRGFLFGTYCPITGIGCLICVLFLSQFKQNPLMVFLLGFIITTAIEYLTSYVMEKVFHARWWDYSTARFNLNGRIKLINSIIFAIGVLLIVYKINPFIVNMLNLIDYKTLKIVFSILVTLFTIDVILSFAIVKDATIKNTVNITDDTEEIKKNTKKYLKQKLNNKQS